MNKKIIGFNGSPRKDWNTATLLKKTLEGAQSQGAQTELFNLYDLKYRGCMSCFACKQREGKSYGKCGIQDALQLIFRQVEDSDGLVFGSPIYLGHLSGQMQSFLERLVFQYLTYTDPPQSLFPKRIPTAFIYTMGVSEQQYGQTNYESNFSNTERFLTRIFGSSQRLLSFDTYQFPDYSKVVASRFNPEEKLKRRNEVFPQDCQKAFQLGLNLARS